MKSNKSWSAIRKAQDLFDSLFFVVLFLAFFFAFTASILAIVWMYNGLVGG